MNIEFINNHSPLYPQVKTLGKKCAATLGFMPEGGFDDYAMAKSIITASEDGILLGYLMFRQTSRYSRVAIAHLAIAPEYRHQGIHAKLLDALRERYQDSGAQGMVLSCRKDYTTASAIWANYGFIAKGTRRSRSLEKHYLTTWWYAFQQRDLFSIAYEENTKVRALMDLNVIVKLRDAEKSVVKLDPKEDPRCLLADWLVEETDLCYAPEVFNEINRDDNLERMRETNIYITGAFTQAMVDAEKMKEIAKELKDILPGTTPNTKSDRKEVASCIVAEIPYFLTYDEDVIKKKEEINARYGIEIFTPQEFFLKIDQLLHSEDYVPVLLKGVVFHTVAKLDAHGIQKHVKEFNLMGKRERKFDFENVVMGCVNAGGELYIVNAQDNCLAFYGLQVNENDATIHFLRIADGSLKGSLLCQIVTNTLHECVSQGQRRILLLENYLEEEQKDTLLRFGFLSLEDGTFVKYIRSEVITKSGINSLLKNNGLETKTETWNKEQMLRLELSFFPLKILDLEIPTYIIPIRAYWAGQLFDSAISGENLFGAKPDKLWSIENVYYRHTKPLTETAPARILWYVSGHGYTGTHAKAVVGCSYLTEMHTGKGQDLYKRFKRYGIYEWEHIYDLCGREKDEDIRALKFSHTELFKRPISYQAAQRILKKNGMKENHFASPVQVSRDVFFDMYEIGKGMWLK
jgi:GNAT superfamily N-acetyltransferase